MWLGDSKKTKPQPTPKKPNTLNLLWSEKQRSATAKLSKEDLIWGTVIKPGNLKHCMDCYKYPCLQLGIQNCNVHLNVPPSKGYLAIIPCFCFNFCAPQFYLYGLSFFSPFLCAACCFRDCQKAPGFAITLGRQAGSAMLLVHPN